MKTVIARNIKSLRILLDKEKKNKIGLVPTMGGLHEGHISLIKKSKSLNYFTVVTIFLNPKQFDHKTDFLKYPATEKKDITLLKKLNVNIIFIPKSEEIYPKKFNTYITENLLSKILCGRKRKNHFTGVLTVVLKLFMLIKPEAAFFGEKDYQQLVVIKKLRDELNFGTKIIPIKTVRNKNGLPLSSRNKYLEINEIEIANKINKICKYLIPKVKNKLNTTKILAHAKRELRMNGIDKIDYLTILTDTLEKRRSLKSKSRIFIAANVGSTRLIDNFPI